MFNGQMELTLGAAPAKPAAFRPTPWRQRARRVSQARWWFARMHQIVDCAVEWQPMPEAPRPEQMLLPAAQPKTQIPAHRPEEQQICE